MPLTDAPGLLSVLQEHDLLPHASPDGLRPLVAQFPTAADLLRELVRRGLLTPFQANEIVQNRAGRLVLGQYLLLERLGQGGMGEVFKARHRVLDRPVALKIIRAEFVDRPDAIERFRRECRAAGRLSHPNIVTVHDAHQVGNTHFLAMEYLEGADLGRLVQKRGALPPGEACEYARQAALGLQHAHEKGMVHRDVKPANLMLTTGGAVKVLDLGLARLRAAEAGEPNSDLTRAGSIMGTPDYLAPEQAGGGSAGADIRADVYSLGCTLFHLLTGRPPFPGKTVQEKITAHLTQPPPRADEVRPGLPAGLAAVVRRMMEKAPAARYSTPGEVAAALAPFSRVGAVPPPLSHSSAPALLPTTVTQYARPVPWRWVVAAGAVVFLAAAAAVVGWALQSSPRPETSKPFIAVQAGDKDKTPARPPDLNAGPDPGPRVPVPVQLPPPPEHVRFGDGLQWPPKECAGVLGEDRGRHWAPVHCVAFRPDGRVIATCDRDNNRSALHLWDAATLRERADWAAPGGFIEDLAFAPDGKTLGAASFGLVRLWDATDHGLDNPRDLPLFNRGPGQPGGMLRRLVFAPDGSQIVAWDEQGSAWRWRRTDKGFREDGFSERITTGTALFAVSADGRMSAHTRLDPATERTQIVVRTLFDKNAPEKVVDSNLAVSAVALSADGRLLAARIGATAGLDGLLRVWDLSKEEPETRDVKLTNTGGPGAVPFFGFSPDGRWIALAQALPGQPANVWLVEVATGVRVELKGHASTIAALSFAADGKAVATGGDDNVLRVWRINGEDVAPFETAPAAGVVQDLAFGPDGALAALSRLRGRSDFGPDISRLVRWDLKTGKARAAFDGPGWFTRCAFCPDGRLIACGVEPVTKPGPKFGLRQGFLRMWGPDGAEEAPPTGLPDDASNFLDGLVLDAAGKTMALVGGYGIPRVACLCDVHPFRVRGPSFKIDAADGLALAPDGGTAAAISSDNTLQFVRFWDVRDPDPAPKALTPKRPLEYPERLKIHALAYSPDGKTLASLVSSSSFGVESAALWLWDVETGKPRTTKDKKGKHAKAVNGFAFSRDGVTVATTGDDGRVVLWRAATLEEMGEWTFPGPVYGVAFDKSGQVLAVGDGDGTVAVLRLPAPEKK